MRACSQDAHLADPRAVLCFVPGAGACERGSPDDAWMPGAMGANGVVLAARRDVRKFRDPDVVAEPA